MRPTLLALAATSTLGLVALAGPALAHVTVNPGTAPGGGYSKLTFRVPTEEDDASTTKLQIFFPTDPAFGSVSVMPQPGWSYKVVEKKLKKPITTEDGQMTQAVSQVTWTATSKSSAIKPGQFQEFNVSLGPLPDSGTVVFKALQTYSNGDVVRWIDPTVAGQPEPDHPAPVLTLTPAADATASASSTSAADGDDSTRSDWALGLSGAAVVIAAGGAALGLKRKKA